MQAPAPFAHPVQTPGSIVLSHEGGDRYAQGIDHHPVETVHFAVGGPGSYIVGSQGIDAGLDDDIGYIVHDGLHPGRYTDTHNPLEHPPGQYGPSSIPSLYISSVFIRARTTRMALNSWDDGSNGSARHPMPTATSSMSRAILVKQLAIRKYRGRLESPTHAGSRRPCYKSG